MMCDVSAVLETLYLTRESTVFVHTLPTLRPIDLGLYFDVILGHVVGVMQRHQ